MNLIFNAKKMDKFIWMDSFLMHQFHKLIKERPQDYNRALKTVFFTYVFGDSVMEQRYNKV